MLEVDPRFTSLTWRAERLRPRGFAANPRASPLKVLRSIRIAARACRLAQRPLVLVPTMGALHRGHAALLQRARRIAGPHGTVVVSIFVNPTQFGPKEDLLRYPRPFADDRKLCVREGVDIIFHPEPAEIYAPDASCWVDEESVSRGLCGASRPGHFRGVCTVVLKLFNITAPDLAVFGRKDFQQCMVIRRMVRDLNVPVQLNFADTVREDDGLALSSRNIYLAPRERAEAVVLYQGLEEARAAFREGETRAKELHQLIVRRIGTSSMARIDYVEIVDAETLAPVQVATGGSVIALAVYFGKTRLIDNLWLE